MKTDKPDIENDLYRLAESGFAARIEGRAWPETELNWRGKEGRTALMQAAIRGDWRTAAALKAAGADLQMLDRDGRRAVDLAALYGHGEVLVCLIEGGCGG